MEYTGLSGVERARESMMCGISRFPYGEDMVGFAVEGEMPSLFWLLKLCGNNTVTMEACMA